MPSNLWLILWPWPLASRATHWTLIGLWLRAGLLLIAVSWLTIVLSLPAVATFSGIAPSHLAKHPIYRLWLSMLASADEGLAVHTLEPYWQWCEVFSARDRVDFMTDSINSQPVPLCGSWSPDEAEPIDQKELDELVITCLARLRAMRQQTASLK